MSISRLNNNGWYGAVQNWYAHKYSTSQCHRL